jgi:hypothetical protein
MRCHSCKQPITSGMEERKRIETRTIGPGATGVSGVGMKVTLAAGWMLGPLLFVEHSKCYHARTRAAERSGRIADRRAADPGHQVHEDRDWRDPRTLEIEDMLPHDGVGGN